MGVLAAALGILTISGYVRLWHVYVFAFVFGAAAALDAPVRQTFVGELVGDEHLPNAVALNSTSFVVGQMIGPVVAGLVIAKVGSGWAFLLNGLSFGAVLLSMSLLCIDELRTSARASRGRGGFIEGLRYVWARPDLRAILAMLFLIGTFGLNFPIFISTMAVNVFHADARGFGLLSSMMAIGTISGALLAAGRDKPGRGTLMLSSGVFGVGCTLAAFSPGYWWFAAALAVIGVAILTFTNATNSIMQLSTTPNMRGRVMATRVGVGLGGTAMGGSRCWLGGNSIRPAMVARHRRACRISRSIRRSHNDGKTCGCADGELVFADPRVTPRNIDPDKRRSHTLALSVFISKREIASATGLSSLKFSAVCSCPSGCCSRHRTRSNDGHSGLTTPNVENRTLAICGRSGEDRV